MAPPEYLTKDDAKDLIKRTVKETLTTMGVDTSDPLEMQRDFQALRDWRRATCSIRKWTMMTIITTFVGGLITIIVIGIKYALTKP